MRAWTSVAIALLALPVVVFPWMIAIDGQNLLMGVLSLSLGGGVTWLLFQGAKGHALPVAAPDDPLAAPPGSGAPTIPAARWTWPARLTHVLYAGYLFTLLGIETIFLDPDLAARRLAPLVVAGIIMHLVHAAAMTQLMSWAAQRVRQA